MDRSKTTEVSQEDGVRAGRRLLIGSAIVAVGNLTAAALAA